MRLSDFIFMLQTPAAMAIAAALFVVVTFWLFTQGERLPQWASLTLLVVDSIAVCYFAFILWTLIHFGAIFVAALFLLLAKRKSLVPSNTLLMILFVLVLGGIVWLGWMSTKFGPMQPVACL